MAATTKAASLRGTSPKHEPSMKRRLTLPVSPVKPTPARVAALARALDTHKEIPPEVVEATNNAISSIARSAHAALKEVEVEVEEATASSPISQDDSGRLNLWLKQRQPVGYTQLVQTNGEFEVKLDSGTSLLVAKRCDPVDAEMPESKRRPSVYHYIRNKQGKLLRVWCDATPYYCDQGVWTSCGSVVWVGVTQDKDPGAWKRAKKLALKKWEESQKRRARQNTVQDTVRLNASQYNIVLAPIPTVIDMVKRNDKDSNESRIIPTIMPSNTADRKVYGDSLARHSRLTGWWKRAVMVAEGAAPVRDDDNNPFLTGGMSLVGRTARQRWEKLVEFGIREDVQLLPWKGEPKVSIVKQDVQTPVIEEVKVHQESPFPGGYADMVKQSEHVRKVDAELPIDSPVVKVEIEETADEPIRLSTKQLRRQAKQEARVEKAHKLDRRKMRKLKRHQQMEVREENEPVVVTEDTPIIIPEASEVVVISGYLPAPANQPIEEVASKPSEFPKKVESWAKYFERKLDGIRPGPLDMDKKLLQAAIDVTICDSYGWDGVTSMTLSMTVPQMKAMLAYVENSKPLLYGMPESVFRPLVSDTDDEKSFDPVNDLEDPDFDEKISDMIGQEQEMLEETYKLAADAQARLREYEWLRALRAQRFATTVEEHRSATGAILKMVGNDRRDEVYAQEEVARLLPPPKVSASRSVQWLDLCATPIHELPLYRKEDSSVIREGLKTKMDRIRLGFARHYVNAHQADVKVTGMWVGERTEFARPDESGWSVGGSVYNDPRTAKVFGHHKGYVEVEFPSWKLAYLHKRKLRRRGEYGTMDVDLAAKRAATHNKLLAKKANSAPISSFVRWVWAVGDKPLNWRHQPAPKQKVWNGVSAGYIYANLDPKEYGLKPWFYPGKVEKKEVKAPTFFDQAIEALSRYFKTEPDFVASKKQISAEIKQRIIVAKEDRTDWYRQYNPSARFTLWMHLRASDDENRLKNWKQYNYPTSVRKHVRRPATRSERPVNIELVHTIVPFKRDFIISPDSSFADTIAAQTKELRNAGIEVSTNDLKKLGLSGVTASSAPEYVTVDGVLYERAKRPAHR